MENNNKEELENKLKNLKEEDIKAINGFIDFFNGVTGTKLKYLDNSENIIKPKEQSIEKAKQYLNNYKYDNEVREAIKIVLKELDNSISKDKVKERIEETDLKINNLKTEISKTLKENEEAGTETEIDINEQYICNMEIELEKLEIAQKVLEKLLEDKQC